MICRTEPRNGGKPITELKLLGILAPATISHFFMLAVAISPAQARRDDFCAPHHRLIRLQRSHCLSTPATLPASLFLRIACAPNPARWSLATALRIPRHARRQAPPTPKSNHSPGPWFRSALFVGRPGPPPKPPAWPRSLAPHWLHSQNPHTSASRHIRFHFPCARSGVGG